MQGFSSPGKRWCMRTRAKWVVGMMIMLAAPALAQVPVEAAPGPMRFEIVHHPSQAGRILFFEARFTNESDKEVSIPWRDTLYEDMFRFTVTGPDGKALVGPGKRMAPPVLSGEG